LNVPTFSSEVEKYVLDPNMFLFSFIIIMLMLFICINLLSVFICVSVLDFSLLVNYSDIFLCFSCYTVGLSCLY